jgi:hypothetical protein
LLYYKKQNIRLPQDCRPNLIEKYTYSRRNRRIIIVYQKELRVNQNFGYKFRVLAKFGSRVSGWKKIGYGFRVRKFILRVLGTKKGRVSSGNPDANALNPLFESIKDGTISPFILPSGIRFFN